MCIVQKAFPNAVLYIIIGAVKPTIISKISKLKVRARQLGLKAVFSGPISHRKALEFMSRLHALVVPRRRTLSTELTIPIKVIEAFALGTPVIITRHKIFEEKYGHGEDILYVEPEPKDVAEKIIMLLTDSHLAKRLSERGPFNSREFNYDVLASRLAEALSGLCKEQKFI